MDNRRRHIALVLASGLEGAVAHGELAFQEQKLNSKSRGCCHPEFADPSACAICRDFVSKMYVSPRSPAMREWMRMSGSLLFTFVPEVCLFMLSCSVFPFFFF